MTKNRNLVAPWVRRFLLEHIVADLNLSRNTQASYRDALALFLPFAAKERRRPVDVRQKGAWQLDVCGYRDFLILEA